MLWDFLEEDSTCLVLLCSRSVTTKRHQSKRHQKHLKYILSVFLQKADLTLDLLSKRGTLRMENGQYYPLWNSFFMITCELYFLQISGNVVITGKDCESWGFQLLKIMTWTLTATAKYLHVWKRPTESLGHKEEDQGQEEWCNLNFIKLRFQQRTENKKKQINKKTNKKPTENLRVKERNR